MVMDTFLDAKQVTIPSIGTPFPAHRAGRYSGACSIEGLVLRKHTGEYSGTLGTENVAPAAAQGGSRR